MILDEAIEEIKHSAARGHYGPYPELRKAIQLGIEALEQRKIVKGVAQFAYKVAETMDTLRSSHVFFILQQAFGEETEWSDAEEILHNIITWGKALDEKLPSETEEGK